eukprot:10786993-Karenia_brevis.AAC.1
MIHQATSQARTVLQGWPTVDVKVYRAALLPRTDEHRHRNNVVHMISTLSAVDQEHLCRFKATDQN